MFFKAKKPHKILSSKEIRKTFIDYFTQNHDHKFVRSSPVVPFCDPTVAFVNAGMNQFKSVFLGTAQPPYKRVVNSQKCVRVGGKHNDLSVVGEDSYHHTFFEMLGNWSFGDYFKREACSMALDLLTGPFNIPTSRLYVTYFAGDKVLGLPADLESFEIWRSLGFPSSRILPFGSSDNFWEMGLTGPCGPCTEIHIDHRPDLASSAEERAKFVNAGRSDLTELWNLVFIQYNRNEDGHITPLPAKHVDTGMGFERLTAVLQNKPSNYDTDIFMPLFNVIHKMTNVPEYNGTFPSQSSAALLDTGYRILADHARMIAVCLADGMLPDQNQKLRRVLRKALTVAGNTFSNENLLTQLIPVVAESLGSAYPEIANRQSAILELIAHEQQVFKALRKTSSKAFKEVLNEFPKLEDIDLIECPGFVPAYREFQKVKDTFKNNKIPGDFLHKLSDTYGLTEEHFQILAQLEEVTYNKYDYQDAVIRAKQKAKSSSQSNQLTNELWQRIRESLTDLTKTLPATENQHKYSYSYDISKKQYILPALKTKVLAILYNDVRVEEIVCKGVTNTQDIVSIVTESSNFYYESGGQQSDKGVLAINTLSNDRHELKVSNVSLINDCVVHKCELPSEKSYFTLAVNDEVELQVDSQHRKRNICHHTATHLLNGAIKSLFNKVTYQISSLVTSDYCKLEVGLIGKRLTNEDVAKIEELINQVILSATPVNVSLCNAADILQQNDVTMVPGEVYPETGLRLLTVNCDKLELLSKELCCGTHVTNTQELEKFCITNFKQTNRARYAFTAVAGEAAEQVFEVAGLLKHRIDMLETELKNEVLNGTETEIQKIRHNIIHMDVQLPYFFKMETLERIREMLKKIKEAARINIKELVKIEMRNVLQEKPFQTHPFILHYLSSPELLEEFPLQKVTQLCTDRPILVISKSDNILKARCVVPKQFQTEKFNAEKWLNEFASVFKAPVNAPKGQNPYEICNMKGKKTSTEFEEQLETAMHNAEKFAFENLK